MPIGKPRGSRIAFFLTVAYAGGIFWLAPHPPMVDLPEHAGQVALLHDLVLGQSPWRDIVWINWFTPYLVGYGLALLLSFLIPVAAAFKLLLMLTYYAFVYGCVLLRRRFDGDERLDWLFIPGFFGFAYVWGFVPFLVAAPFGLLFILLADRYAESPGIANGILLSVTGALLFFCHGLIFLFACAIAVAMVATRNRSLRRMIPGLLPFLPLAVLSLVYSHVKNSGEREVAFPLQDTTKVFWNWGWIRLRFFVQVFGASENDWNLLVFGGVAGSFMLLAPILMRSSINRRTSSAAVPIAVLVLLWLSTPSSAIGAALIYQRFAVFILPFYALMFRRRPPPASGIEKERVQARACQTMLAVLCWTFLAMQTERTLGFAQESREFEAVSAAAEPGRRALTLAFQANSEAAGNPSAYLHYPLWYQVEGKGIVDVNFACCSPALVRFKRDETPKIRSSFEWTPEGFEWDENEAWKYRYFFVRRSTPLPVAFFNNERCEISLVKSVGTWSLYENVRCR